ncbi:MAG TPA: hypothetical protein VKA48_02000 [Gammaproteobacteria bacterium]|nr:hypothetical protein [Gammaproteobacteria bacterium]
MFCDGACQHSAREESGSNHGFSGQGPRRLGRDTRPPRRLPDVERRPPEPERGKRRDHVVSGVRLRNGTHHGGAAGGRLCHTYPYRIPPEKGTRLDNSFKHVGTACSACFFQAVDEDPDGKDFVFLRPGLMRPKKEASYRIPAGRRGTRFLMDYAPRGIGAFKRQY